MSATISIQEASARLTELIHSLGPSDEIILTENEEPVARILPNNLKGLKGAPRVPGLLKGKLTIVSDDDEIDSPPTIYHDLDALAGTWSEEDAAAFDAATEGTRHIDAELWR